MDIFLATGPVGIFVHQLHHIGTLEIVATAYPNAVLLHFQACASPPARCRASAAGGRDRQKIIISRDIERLFFAFRLALFLSRINTLPHHNEQSLCFFSGRLDCPGTAVHANRLPPCGAAAHPVLPNIAFHAFGRDTYPEPSQVRIPSVDIASGGWFYHVNTAQGDRSIGHEKRPST
jgi:hypothetical protein